MKYLFVFSNSNYTTPFLDVNAIVIIFKLWIFF